MTNIETGAGWKKIVYKCKKYARPFSEMLKSLFLGWWIVSTEGLRIF